MGDRRRVRGERDHARGSRRVLELGCRTGQLARRLADLGLDVTGIDLSPASVARARARGVAALVVDLRRPPFAGGSFADALAFNSLQLTLSAR